MKKVIAAVLLMLIAATLLTGCQSEEEKRRQKAKELGEQILGTEPYKYGETNKDSIEKSKQLREKMESEKKK